MVYQREALADTTELTDMVYLVCPDGILNLNPFDLLAEIKKQRSDCKNDDVTIDGASGKDIPNEFAKVYKELFNREHDENQINSILNKLNLDITAESLQNVDKINTVTIKEALDKIKPKKSDPTWDFS